jgi:lipoprotein-releasing system permease protein
MIMITQSLAYPVEFHLSNVLIVIFTIVVLGYLAALIASARIGKKLVE